MRAVAQLLAGGLSLLTLALPVLAEQPDSDQSRQTDPRVMPRPPAPDPELWKRALTLYSLGEPEQALTLLREEVQLCAQGGGCSTQVLATLYASVAIVQAGGMSQHSAAVVAFRKALALNPALIVLAEYRIAPVASAFEEAKAGKVSPSTATAPVTSPAPRGSAEQEERSDEAPSSKKRSFILLSFIAQTGKLGSSGSDAGVYDIGDRFGNLGGTFTLAGMPGRTSGFTMGGRVRGGAYLSPAGTLWHYGVSGVLGGTTGARENDHFSYFLGGIGFNEYPDLGASALLLSFYGGGSIGGLLIGGNIEVPVGPQLWGFMFGVEIGVGTLLGK